MITKSFGVQKQVLHKDINICPCETMGDIFSAVKVNIVAEPEASITWLLLQMEIWPLQRRKWVTTQATYSRPRATPYSAEYPRWQKIGNLFFEYCQHYKSKNRFIQQVMHLGPKSTMGDINSTVNPQTSNRIWTT